MILIVSDRSESIGEITYSGGDMGKKAKRSKAAGKAAAKAKLDKKNGVNKGPKKK